MSPACPADGGEVRLVIPGPDVLRVFAISGLDRVISCHSDLDQALAQANPHQPGASAREDSAALMCEHLS